MTERNVRRPVPSRRPTSVKGTVPARRRPVQKSSMPQGERIRCILLAVTLIAMLVFTVLQFAENNVRDISLEAQAIVYQSEMTEIGLNRATESRLCKNLTVSTEAWNEWIYFTSDSLMEVSELLIVKCPDPEILSSVETAVQARLKAQKTSFEGYGTNQTELLRNAVVSVKGQYLFYAVGEKADRWEEVFLSRIR